MNESSAKYASDIPVVERYVEVLLLSVIASLSTAANVSLWMVVLGTRSLRNESNNKLLLSLSLADILVSVVSMPITVVTVYLAR